MLSKSQLETQITGRLQSFQASAIFFHPSSAWTSTIPASVLGAGLLFPSFSFRSHNFSQDARNLFLVRSDIAAQKFSQGYGSYVCRIHGQAQGLCIPSKLHWHRVWIGHHSCKFSQYMTSKSHTRGSPTGSETDSHDPYNFMALTNTPFSAF